jgi:hypothetical protein
LAKGLVNKTMVASAAPATKIKPAEVVAQAAFDAENEVDGPQPVLASYTPNVTDIADDPHQPGSPPPPGRLFTYASAGGMGLPMPNLFRPAAAPKQQQAALPTYQDAKVVGAPEADDDHPDELSYVPFEIAGLMTDASVTYSRTVAPLTHPEQTSIDYLFEDMNQQTAFTLRNGSGYTGLASAQRFSGHAVRNFYAEMATQAPTRLAQSTR